MKVYRKQQSEGQPTLYFQHWILLVCLFWFPLWRCAISRTLQSNGDKVANAFQTPLSLPPASSKKLSQPSPVESAAQILGFISSLLQWSSWSSSITSQSLWSCWLIVNGWRLKVSFILIAKRPGCESSTQTLQELPVVLASYSSLWLFGTLWDHQKDAVLVSTLGP